MFSNFSPENLALYEVTWTNIEGPEQVADGNMTQAYGMLGTLGYQHTLRICNTYRLSTATVVTRTRHDITLRIHIYDILPVLLFQAIFALIQT